MRLYLIAAVVNIFYPNIWSAPHSFILSFSSLRFLCTVPAPFQLTFALRVHLFFCNFIHLVSSSTSFCAAPNVFHFSLVWFLIWLVLLHCLRVGSCWVFLFAPLQLHCPPPLPPPPPLPLRVHSSPTKPSHTRLVAF